MRGTALPLSPLLLRVEIHPSVGAADICVEDLAEYGTCTAAEAPRSDSSSPVHGCSGRTGGSARIQAVILPEKSSPFFILSAHLFLVFFYTSGFFLLVVESQVRALFHLVRFVLYFIVNSTFRNFLWTTGDRLPAVSGDLTPSSEPVFVRSTPVWKREGGKPGSPVATSAAGPPFPAYGRRRRRI